MSKQFNCREAWTESPGTASQHVNQNLDEGEKAKLVIQWSVMAAGGDGGHIEPWGPSIRSTIYPNWSNADFSTAIRHVEDSIR
jgi:hypothetical protein